MERGTVDPDLAVDVYQSDKVWDGTTILADNHIKQRRRIIEVNMLGEIIWEYVVPGTNWVEAELLPSNNILYLQSGHAVYEIDRNGKIVWSYLTSKIDHDADRLPNGNTIFVFGMRDQKSDAQVTEVNPKGLIVWRWYAKDYFDKSPYSSIDVENSWTHCNAVTRLTNGNTLISLRNFDLVVEVDPKGEVTRTIGEGIFDDQHDPEILANGNLLVANHNLRLPQYVGKPQRALEFDPETGKIVWEFLIPDKHNWPVRDANRLPNGNTLITGTTEIVEVTPEGVIVWRLRLQGINFSQQESIELGFYKAERISTQK
jgi:outer membrane protein assembly factor BamB